MPAGAEVQPHVFLFVIFFRPIFGVKNGSCPSQNGPKNGPKTAPKMAFVWENGKINEPRFPSEPVRVPSGSLQITAQKVSVSRRKSKSRGYSNRFALTEVTDFNILPGLCSITLCVHQMTYKMTYKMAWGWGFWCTNKIKWS